MNHKLGWLNFGMNCIIMHVYSLDQNYYIFSLIHLLLFLHSDVSKVLSQTIDTRIKLADALARQWFGAYITPEAPSDGKLL